LFIYSIPAFSLSPSSAFPLQRFGQAYCQTKELSLSGGPAAFFFLHCRQEHSSSPHPLPFFMNNQRGGTTELAPSPAAPHPPSGANQRCDGLLLSLAGPEPAAAAAAAAAAALTLGLAWRHPDWPCHRLLIITCAGRGARRASVRGSPPGSAPRTGWTRSPGSARRRAARPGRG